MAATALSSPVAHSQAERPSLALLRRFETPPDLTEYVVDQLEQVIPSHSAESLSRALGTIPFYARLNEALGATSLANASTATTNIRLAMQGSLYTTASIRALLPRLVYKLRTLGSTPTADEIRFVRLESMNLVTIAQKTRHTINGLLSSLVQISVELKRDIDAPSGDGAKEIWSHRLRVGALCAGGPSFATAILSAVYNNTNPQLSQAMAVASACVGLCATAVPCVLQWYWEHRGKHSHIQRADQVSAHIELQRMQYPLRLLAKWWRRLNNRLQTLAATNAGPKQAAEMYDAIIPQLDQYAREVMTVLKSVEDPHDVDEPRLDGDVAEMV